MQIENKLKSQSRHGVAPIFYDELIWIDHPLRDASNDALLGLNKPPATPVLLT